MTPSPSKDHIVGNKSRHTANIDSGLLHILLFIRVYLSYILIGRHVDTQDSIGVYIGYTISVQPLHTLPPAAFEQRNGWKLSGTSVHKYDRWILGCDTTFASCTDVTLLAV